MQSYVIKNSVFSNFAENIINYTKELTDVVNEIAEEDKNLEKVKDFADDWTSKTTLAIKWLLDSTFNKQQLPSPPPPHEAVAYYIQTKDDSKLSIKRRNLLEEEELIPLEELIPYIKKVYSQTQLPDPYLNIIVDEMRTQIIKHFPEINKRKNHSIADYYSTSTASPRA